MYRVVIADDDLPILEDLRSMDWSSMDCTLAGCARNGYELLKMCPEAKPDIVITDIVMPGLDGLELASLLTAWDPSIQILILTSYKDFEYARRALQLGVGEYLLKGVYTEDELAAAIRRAQGKLAVRGSDRAAPKDPAAEYRRFMAYLGVDREPVPDAEMQALFPCRIASLALRWDSSPSSLGALKLLSLFKDCSKAVFLDPDRELHAVFPADPPMPKDLLPGLLARAETEFRQDGLRATAVPGAPAKDQREGRQAIEQNRARLRIGFYAGAPSVLDEAAPVCRSLYPQERQTMLAELRSLVGDGAKLAAYLEKTLLPFALGQAVSPDEVRLLCTRILTDSSHARFDRLQAIVGRLLDCGDSRSLLLLMREGLAELRKAGGSSETAQALALVEARFSERLLLEDVAAAVGYSPNYLGFLFKRDTGVSFKEYLTRKRMEKAYELLKNTTLKVYEVADRVGLPNYRYFETLFKKTYNLSPVDLRGGH